MLCSTKCIEAFLHILALQLCLSSALQHWIDVGEGLLHKVHARCLIPSLTSMTPQSLELSSMCILNLPVNTLWHCLQMLMECTKTWYIIICLCSKKVFKLFDTLYVQCCLPLVVAQGDDTTAVQRRIFQYFTANVLLYKLDVWCSLFVVLPQHWAWWFIMKLCLAAALCKCVLYIIELLFEWLVMLFRVILDIPFFDVWCRKE